MENQTKPVPLDTLGAAGVDSLPYQLRCGQLCVYAQLLELESTLLASTGDAEVAVSGNYPAGRGDAACLNKRGSVYRCLEDIPKKGVSGCEGRMTISQVHSGPQQAIHR
ncbi:hypothetical protein KBB12_04015 [Candidatus Woesebacteria bacterium]|nr:hypothetical protein [Candidatus Woesebacteria bacterium]